MIVIIDYGMGNLRSISKAFERLNIPTVTSSGKRDIEGAEKIILPGVGHFETGMKNLIELDLVDLLKRKILIEKVPVLGICLGLQLFTRSSEEGHAGGLGLIEAVTVRFNFSGFDDRLKVPHMGWNSVRFKEGNPLFESEQEELFYFVHSYHIQCPGSNEVLCTTRYGYEFASGIWKENIFGTQFHPEKSHASGLKLLENFSRL